MATSCRSMRATGWWASSAPTGAASVAAASCGATSTRSSPHWPRAPSGRRGASMADLHFGVTGVDVVPYAASPQLAFHLRVDAGPGTTVYTVALRCQIQIEPGRRQYQPEEQAKLRDLFGEPE